MRKRTIKICIALVLVAVLSLWVKSRWHAWFVNAPETEYVVPIEPSRITVLPGEQFYSSRIVTWRADTVLKPSYLYLKNDSNVVRYKAHGNVINSRGGRDAIYSVELKSLKQGAKYSYCVSSGDCTSPWNDISIPVDNGKLTFAYIGDVQDTLGGNSGKLIREIYKRHSECDFWAFGGDLLEGPDNKYWDFIYKEYAPLFSSMPVIVAAGNHEYIKYVWRKLDFRWAPTFNYHANGASPNGKTYFVDFGNTLRMIVLDTNGIRDPFELYSQYSWLKKVLSESKQKSKVVMMHHPVYSVRKGKNERILRYTFVPLFEKYGAQLILMGHEHGYGRRTTPGLSYPVYIVSHASPKTYMVGDNNDFDTIIGDTRMYQIITVNKDKLYYKAYNDNHGLTDSISINLN